jgi:hypothetical protein
MPGQQWKLLDLKLSSYAQASFCVPTVLFQEVTEALSRGILDGKKILEEYEKLYRKYERKK